MEDFTALDKPKPRGSASLAAVVSAFVPAWTTALLFVAAFVLVRQKCPKIYYPRTFMGTIPKRHRTPMPMESYFGWLRTMGQLSDKFLLYHQSLDAYLYLRFLRITILICLVGSCLTWPTLMPVNATAGGSSSELDKVGIGNVANKDSYYAHAVLAWVFFAFILFTITRERLWLITLRQVWTYSKHNASKQSSRTVLFLSASKEALEEANMARIFGEGAVRIWPAFRVTDVDHLVSERQTSVEELESAETTFIQRAWARVRKMRRSNTDPEGRHTGYKNLPHDVQKKIRPRRRFGFGRMGEKVDSIEWLRDRLQTQQSEVAAAGERHEVEADSSAAVFVEFKTASEAQKVVQQVLSTEILALTPRYLGVAPKEVVWENLTLSAERRISQEGVSTAIVTALILFWSIPSGLVGILSNISYLADNVEWLAWLNKLPDPVIGLLSGLLPPLATSLLSKYVPDIFRSIFKSFGGATTTSIELRVQKWFYIFQVTQVFLVTAVFSGAATIFSELLTRLKDPSSIPRLLAKELPKSSNYYLTYFIIQGITTSADNLLNWSDLLQYVLSYRFLDKTPRQKYSRYTSMKGIAWGKVFPKAANFAIIAIAYSCIAPLVLGFATVGLSLYYFAYRYNLLFVIQPKVETRGQAYTLALQQLLTGVYIGELALIGIFGLGSARGPVIIVVVLFFATIIYHYLMNTYIAPLEHHLPTSLTAERSGGDEVAPLLSSAEEGLFFNHRGSEDGDAYQQTQIWNRLLASIARFFEPYNYATYRATEQWLREDDGDFQALEEDANESTQDDPTKSYKNPALTSSTPIVWLPKDEAGTSGYEIDENEKAGIKSTDRGAWLDEKGNVHWSEGDFKDVPL